MNKRFLSQPEIEETLADLGLKRKQSRIGAAIALVEAPAGKNTEGLYQANFSAVGDQALANDTWGYSYGGFQIRSLRSQKGTGLIRDEDELLRPRFNCRSAIAIRRAWGGWGAWTTFSRGTYKAFLQDMFPPPPGTHVVMPGDTLEKIAEAISGGHWVWQDLARVNGLSSPYTIYISQILALP